MWVSERTLCAPCLCNSREHATPGWSPPMLGRPQPCEMHMQRLIAMTHGATIQETANLLARTLRYWEAYCLRTGAGTW